MLFHDCPATRSDLHHTDYTSVVFVGFAAISTVWYLIGMSLCYWWGYLDSHVTVVGGRYHYAGPPMPGGVEKIGSHLDSGPRVQ